MSCTGCQSKSRKGFLVIFVVMESTSRLRRSCFFLICRCLSAERRILKTSMYQSKARLNCADKATVISISFLES